MSKGKQQRQQLRKRRLVDAAIGGQVARERGSAQDAGTGRTPGNAKDFLRLYVARQYDELSRGLLRILLDFSSHIFSEVNSREQATLDAFAECLLYLFGQEDYVISPPYRKSFISFMPTIANLVAMSRFQTTDPQLEILRGQPNSFPKILPLYSARNRVEIDSKWLFDQDSELASIWYARFLQAPTWSATQIVYENQRHHLRNIDGRYQVRHPFATKPIFYCTYIDDRTERPINERINAAIGRQLGNVHIRNQPARRSIALISSFWAPKTSVHRGLRPFIEALADCYDLTLVHLEEPRDDLDTRGFRDVKRVWIEQGGKLNADSLADNDFSMAFFTDVGMTMTSIYLSNLRIAPIQVTCYGHPTSTWSPEIDYYLGGTELEVLPGAEKNYSERLILIPGGAVFPTIPDYQLTRPERPDSHIVINCVWNTAKCNWPMLMVLKKIMGAAKKKIVFQFLPVLDSLRGNGFVPHKKDIESTMGAENVRVLVTRFDTYMHALETGHFSVDSYPFGSFTGVVDALHVGLPMVTWQGKRCYNISASRLMRKAGLEELVATSQDQYIEIVCRLIDDDEYRNELSDRIRQLDLKGRLFDPKEVDYFVKAIDYLMANHEALKQDTSREPILIE